MNLEPWALNPEPLNPWTPTPYLYHPISIQRRKSRFSRNDRSLDVARLCVNCISITKRCVRVKLFSRYRWINSFIPQSGERGDTWIKRLPAKAGRFKLRLKVGHFGWSRLIVWDIGAPFPNIQKSPPTPLYQRGEPRKSPFTKGGFRGIFGSGKHSGFLYLLQYEPKLAKAFRLKGEGFEPGEWKNKLDSDISYIPAWYLYDIVRITVIGWHVSPLVNQGKVSPFQIQGK